MGLFSREPEDPGAVYREGMGEPEVTTYSDTVTFYFVSGGELEVTSPTYDEVLRQINEDVKVIDCVDLDGDRHGVVVAQIEDFYQQLATT